MRQQFQFFNIFGSDLKIDKDGEQARDDKDFRNLTLELSKTPKIKIFWIWKVAGVRVVEFAGTTTSRFYRSRLPKLINFYFTLIIIIKFERNFINILRTGSNPPPLPKKKAKRKKRQKWIWMIREEYNYEEETRIR